MATPLTTTVQPAAVLRVSGEDTPTYLQSQCSNDLRSLEPGHCCYGLWLDRKGKVCADSFVFLLGAENYLLVSYHCPAEALIAKLEENIIADEVEIEDLTANAELVVEIGLPEAEIPAAGTCERVGEGDAPSALRFAGRRSRLPCRETLWLAGRPAGEEIVPTLDVDGLAYERIAAGIAAVPQDIGPGDLPQEGGLEKVAVSFNKGCYLGQEVMARLHAMGRTQRALHRVELEKLPAALPVDILDPTGKAVGELRSAASGDDSVIGLAMLKKRALENGGPFSLADGANVQIVEALA